MEVEPVFGLKLTNMVQKMETYYHGHLVDCFSFLHLWNTLLQAQSIKDRIRREKDQDISAELGSAELGSAELGSAELGMDVSWAEHDLKTKFNHIQLIYMWI